MSTEFSVDRPGRASEDADAQTSSATHLHLTAGQLLAEVDARRTAPGGAGGAVQPRFFAAWGGACLLGFGLAFLRFGSSGSAGDPVRAISPGPAWVLVAVPLLVAFAAAGVPMVRARRAGAPVDVLRLHAAAWLLMVGSLLPLMGYIVATAPAGWKAMYALSALVCGMGLAHLFSAALWRNSLQLLYGGLMCVSVMPALAAGPGWYALVYAVLLGAGGLGIARVSSELSRRRDVSATPAGAPDPGIAQESGGAAHPTKGRTGLRRLVPGRGAGSDPAGNADPSHPPT